MKVFECNKEAYSYARTLFGNNYIFSFDVFDTLLHRYVEPDAVLHALAGWLKAQANSLQYNIIDDILGARDKAYLEIANKYASQGFDQEVRYREFSEKWVKAVFPDLPESRLSEMTDSLTEKEQNMEKAVVYANADAKDFIAECFNNNEKVILVSDMYLDEYVVRDLLKELGYNNDKFLRVYVSSNQGLLKRTGNIFDMISEDLGISDVSIFYHFGDNFESDGVQPVNKGWNGHVVRDERTFALIGQRNSNFHTCKNDPAWAGYVASKYAFEKIRMASSHGLYENSQLGPVLAGYMHAAIEECIAKGISSVYFLSREGAVLKVIFDEICSIAFPEYEINSHYLYTSRLASFTPSTRKGVTWKGIQNAIRNTGNYSVKSIFSPYRIEDSLLARLASEYSLPPINQPLPAGFENWAPFLRFLNDTELNAVIAAKGVEQHELFIRYLDGLGFFEEDQVALVDVGWSGQIQDNIFDAVRGLENSPTIVGLYAGCNVSSHERGHKKSQFCWYLADESHLGWYGQSTLQSVFILESLTRAPHATVLGYRIAEDGNSVMPVFKSTHEPSRAVEMKSDGLLAAYQKNSIEFARYYAEAICLFDFTSQEVLPFSRACMESMIRFPNQDFAGSVGSIQNVSDLGSDEIIALNGCKPEFMDLLKRRVFCLWPYGAIADLGLVKKAIYAAWSGYLALGRDRCQPRMPVYEQHGVIKKPKCAGQPHSLNTAFQVNEESHLLRNLIYDAAKGEDLPLSDVSRLLSLRQICASYLSMRIANFLCKLRGKEPYYNDAIPVKVMIKQVNPYLPITPREGVSYIKARLRMIGK